MKSGNGKGWIAMCGHKHGMCGGRCACVCKWPLKHVCEVRAHRPFFTSHTPAHVRPIKVCAWVRAVVNLGVHATRKMVATHPLRNGHMTSFVRFTGSRYVIVCVPPLRVAYVFSSSSSWLWKLRIGDEAKLSFDEAGKGPLLNGRNKPYPVWLLHNSK